MRGAEHAHTDAVAPEDPCDASDRSQNALPASAGWRLILIAGRAARISATQESCW
jgi:hypothetical protein